MEKSENMVFSYLGGPASQFSCSTNRATVVTPNPNYRRKLSGMDLRH